MTKRVLVIDDEENIRQMTRLALEAAGYEVGEAGTGMEAFAILGGDPLWDVVLLDQKMPGMVGTEVLKRIKVLAPTARVIMVTAFASVDLAVEAMKLGASDFVRKPTTPEILRNALAAALAKAPEPPSINGVAHDERQASTQVTLNGFTILRASDIRGTLAERPNERCFIVKTPDGAKQEVIVEIDREAVSAVEAVTNNLPLQRSFWTEQAEQFLSDFIWNDGHAPANGRLRLKAVEGEALVKATREEVTNEQTHSNN
jgi:CheY-like chemotaxis protein